MSQLRIHHHHARETTHEVNPLQTIGRRIKYLLDWDWELEVAREEKASEVI